MTKQRRPIFINAEAKRQRKLEEAKIVLHSMKVVGKNVRGGGKTSARMMWTPVIVLHERRWEDSPTTAMTAARTAATQTPIAQAAIAWTHQKKLHRSRATKCVESTVMLIPSPKSRPTTPTPLALCHCHFRDRIRECE